MAKNSYEKKSQPLIIFPYPQKVSANPDGFIMPDKPKVSIGGAIDSSSVRTLIKRVTGCNPRTADSGDSDIRVYVGQEAPRMAKEWKIRGAGNAFEKEGYILQVSGDGVSILASDYSGLFNSVQSLAQLTNADGGTISGVYIADWPRFPIRGAHVYIPARDDLPFFKRFIEFLARCKFNTLFLEIGAGMRYDSHPEINEGWERTAGEAARWPASQSRMQNSYAGHKNSIHIELGGGSYLTKDEVRRIIGWCKDNRIEIIPEVQSLSHSYYLLASHGELAENPEDPYPDTYCPSNPKTYKQLFEVMQEVIDLFRPKTLSIGHDEVYTIGECPRCKGKDRGKLLADDIIKIHDFLAERNIRTAMWSEKLHHVPARGRDTWKFSRFGKKFRGDQPDTTGALKRIPRDILLLNWFTGIDPESVRLLREEGFDQIIGNFNPQMYVNSVAEKSGQSLQELISKDSRGEKLDPMKRPTVLGAERSTWYGMKPKNVSPYGFMFTAQTLWWKEMSPKHLDKMKDGFALIHLREAHRLHGTKSVLCTPGAKKFNTIDLAPVADNVCDGQPRMWGGFGNMDLRNIPAGDVELAGAPFHILDYPGTRQAPFIGVDANMRGSFPAPVGMRARALLFLHTSSVKPARLSPWTSLHLPPCVIAVYEIRYKDGKTVEAEIEHGWTVGHVSQQEPPKHAALAWRGRNAAGEPISLFMMEWVNLRPRTDIESVTMLWRGEWLPGEVVCAAITTIE